MLVPAFFLVNVFVNATLHGNQHQFLGQLIWNRYRSRLFCACCSIGSVGFIVFPEIQIIQTCHVLYTQIIYHLKQIRMKTPYKNIYNVLKLNRFIVLAVVVCALLWPAHFRFGWYSTTNQKALNSAFAINTDGSIIPLKLVTQKENFQG